MFVADSSAAQRSARRLSWKEGGKKTKSIYYWKRYSKKAKVYVYNTKEVAGMHFFFNVINDLKTDNEHCIDIRNC